MGPPSPWVPPFKPGSRSPQGVGQLLPFQNTPQQSLLLIPCWEPCHTTAWLGGGHCNIISLVGNVSHDCPKRGGEYVCPSHWWKLCHMTTLRRAGNVGFLSRGNCPGPNRGCISKKELEGDSQWAACGLCPNIYNLVFIFVTSLDPHKHVCCKRD